MCCLKVILRKLKHNEKVHLTLHFDSAAILPRWLRYAFIAIQCHYAHTFYPLKAKYVILENIKSQTSPFAAGTISL